MIGRSLSNEGEPLELTATIPTLQNVRHETDLDCSYILGSSY